MKKQINRVKEIDVQTVDGNKTLATGADTRAVKRCKDAIESLGLLHTPIVGMTKGGRRLVLSGQPELAALRELGIKKMDAIEIDMSGDEKGAAAKWALLLMSLRAASGALCEGLLLQEAVSAGVPRLEIQAMLGKSASWVSNRISLVTRLDSGVYELVRGGLLDPRSAQEVARLPQDVQYPFADIAVREGLPKSAIESLVAGYNDEGCPDAVKTQILRDPRAALMRMSDRRRAVNTERSGNEEGSAPAHAIDECIRSVRFQAARLFHLLFGGPTPEAECHKASLKGLETELSALLAAVRGLVSPGKTEVENNAG